MKILKISNLPTTKQNKVGWHIYKTSEDVEKYDFYFVKLNKGEVLNIFKKDRIIQYVGIYKLILTILRMKPDIISIHNYKLLFLPLLVKIVRPTFNSKFLYTFHGQDKRLMDFFVIRIFIRILYHGLITLDYKLSKKFNIQFMPNGLDSLEKVVSRKKMNTKSIKIFFPASFKKVKNHSWFIKFLINNFNSKNISVNFAGEGELKEKLKNLINSFSKNEIEFNFLGNISFKEMIYHYLTCSFVVLPSKEEAASKVVLESILYKSPIITSRVGSSEYYLGEKYPYFLDFENEKHNILITKNIIQNYSNFEYIKSNIPSWGVISNNYLNYYGSFIK